MKWRGREASQNVEDRRGIRPAAVGGGLGMVVILVLGLIFGLNRDQVQQLVEVQRKMGGGAAVEQVPVDATPEETERLNFVKVVLRDTEKVWGEQFRKMGMTYREPTLVVFREAVESACGLTQAAVGPFYCPADEQIYIDLSFFEELEQRHQAPGDFAQAYVIAHEVGHHVQKLLGITDKVNSLRGRLSQVENNELSVRLELQADFLAGVWAHDAESNFQILEEGDLQEAINAAAQIGDDRLQLEATGRVRPDAFTHGTSKQRMEWFRRGFTTGDVNQGDTFGAKAL
ncbi:MAG: KPN_02809 family neutral zinc metallopeptidase [Pirellulaceae bacterium]